MKNHKQLLADFYLELLAIPNYHHLKYAVLKELSDLLEEDMYTVKRIFERMAQEDKANG